MNQSAGDELEYQELLILAYFKANYKRYEFNEIIHIMGMTYEEMIGKIDNLLEKKYLVNIKNYIVISKIGENILKTKGFDKFYCEDYEDFNNVSKKQIDPNQIYIPIEFKL